MVLEKIIQNYDIRKFETVGEGPGYLGYSLMEYHFLLGEDCFNDPADFCVFISPTKEELEKKTKRPMPKKIYRMVEYDKLHLGARVQEITDREYLRKFVSELSKQEYGEMIQAERNLKAIKHLEKQMNRVLNPN